jgi:hypothetical protein
MFDILTAWANEGVLGYVAVALAAATPWLEVLLVIPPAVALGLDPFLVGVTAFGGNYLPVAGIVYASRHVRRRFRDRERRPSRRSERARRLLDRYGVPGLALLGPLVTGVHLAALLALATGASRRRVLGWTGASLLVWTVAITVASVLGADLLTR